MMRDKFIIKAHIPREINNNEEDDRFPEVPDAFSSSASKESEVKKFYI